VFSVGIQEGKQSLPLVLLTQPPDYSPHATCPPSLPMSLKGCLMNNKKGAAHRAEFNKTNLRPCPYWLSQMKSTKSGGEKSKFLTLFSLTVKSAITVARMSYMKLTQQIHRAANMKSLRGLRSLPG
jgi:hypothetical protein